MNSVFNLASHNFNQLADDELLSWLHSEGLANICLLYTSDAADE